MQMNVNGHNRAEETPPGDLRPSEELSGTTPPRGLSEDIWAVIIGSVLIAMVLIAALISPGFKFSTPVYQWENASDLANKVLSLNNLLLLGSIGIVLAVLS